jgi:hypothetical protein
MVSPIRPCARMALAQISGIFSRNFLQQRRFFKTNAIPSSSIAASHMDGQQEFASISISSVSRTSLKDPIAVALKIEETPSKGPNMFQADHSLSSKSTVEIIRALSIYHLCSFTIFVRNGRKLYDISSSILGHAITDGILKKTFFAQFCGGTFVSTFPISISFKPF